MALQLRSLLLHHVPHELVIHTEVAVDEPVPHPGNQPPLHLRMLRAEPHRELLDRLSDHFQAADERTPKRLVGIEAVEGEPLTVLDQELRLDQDVLSDPICLERHHLSHAGSSCMRSSRTNSLPRSASSGTCSWAQVV